MIEVRTSEHPLEEGAKGFETILKKHQEKDMLLLFSGGSSLALIDHMHPKVLTKQCTISALDERFTFDHIESNYAKIERTTFFEYARDMGVSYIDPRPRDGETVKEAGKRFDTALKHWHITHRDGIVLATVGIGADGHTAGILPMPHNTDSFKQLFLREHVCAVGYEVMPETSRHTERLTATLTYFMRHVGYAFVYATGLQKKEVLQTMLQEGNDYARIPSRILHKVSQATLYTDIHL